MNLNLKRKKILIIGSEGLIGREIFKQLKGHKAKILGVDIINLKKNNYILFNEKNKNEIEKLFKKIITSFGCPDILINCSYPKSENWNSLNMNKIDFDNFSKALLPNVSSPIVIANKFANEMKKKKINGSLIFFGSIYGHLAQDLDLYLDTPMRAHSVYPAAKGALIAMTKQFASYYGKYSIRTNIICPGGIRDPKNIHQNKMFLKKYNKKNPLKRMATPKEIATATIFFSSPKASYLNGQSILIDGGYSIV